MERKKIGLGYNLPNILGKPSDDNAPLTELGLDRIEYISLDKIKSGMYQPRREFDNASIEELASSIKEQGIIQPIILRKNQNYYEIIAGERRWRAAQLAGFSFIPSIVKKLDEKSIAAFSLIENIQREDLNPIEEAYAYKKLKDEFNMSQDDIAKAIGKPRPTIANSMRLLNLEPYVQTLLINHSLEKGHAKLIVNLDPNEQITVAKIIVDKKLTVRETEKLIQKTNEPSIPTDKYPTIESSRIKDWQDRLSMHLPSSVRLKVDHSGRGKVVIHVESEQELEWIIKKFEDT